MIMPDLGLQKNFPVAIQRTGYQTQHGGPTNMKSYRSEFGEIDGLLSTGAYQSRELHRKVTQGAHVASFVS